MLVNKILKLTIFKKRISLISRKQHLYQQIINTTDIEAYQIEHFNKIWSHAYKNIPFYVMWKEKYGLPDFIYTINELNLFPPLSKADIQANYDLIMSNLSNCKTISTGGSTGEPVKFPTSNIESDLSYGNHYLARGWWNITSLDKVLLFWGHSHLFGNGFKGQINKYKRLFFDFIIGTHRISAYDLSEDRLKSLHYEIYNSDPTMILGYTSTICKIAKYIEENNLSVGDKPNLKGVVVTSESVSDYDVEIIEKVFKVPCIIEYGMAETGVIAYSKQQTYEIKVLWDSFIVQKNKNGALYLTTISEKKFPLINYQTNDIIDSEDEGTILTIKKIIGRKNDFIEIIDGNKLIKVHSELFTHVLKSIPGISNFQIIQKSNKKIVIKYICRIKAKIDQDFFYEIKKEYPLINQNEFTFEQVDKIEPTVSGKAKWILIEKE